eukprot:SAG31_NODE_354_length_17223_cov_18.708771_1_plen_576_part_00
MAPITIKPPSRLAPPARTPPPLLLLLLLLLLALLLGPDVAAAQEPGGCTIQEFEDAADVVALCCESVPGLCRDAFPATCSHTCARTLVPYMERCGAMVESMTDEIFPQFHLSQLPAFTAACEQTMLLYQSAAGAGLCAEADVALSDGLVSRVEEVNEACCEQGGQNVCTGGEPPVCDAECAATFLPYWHQCLDRDSTLGGGMHPFQTLHEACTDRLPHDEVMALYRDVTEMEDSPECTIDTSQVVSMTQAKLNAVLPTCQTDAFSSCASFVAAGIKTCENDLCELCPEAHTCDHTCELPCAEPTGASDDASGHRLLAEGAHIGGWAGGLADMTATCPLSAFEDRLAEVDGICCSGSSSSDGDGDDGGGDVACVDGMPQSCPYSCGRRWTEFYRDCEPVINVMFPSNAADFSSLTEQCLQVDPVGMTLALAGAVCCADCGEHGECDVGSGGCRCEGGYSGESCEAHDPCFGVDCGQHGQCVGGVCACDPGYSGERCETDWMCCDRQYTRQVGACCDEDCNPCNMCNICDYCGTAVTSCGCDGAFHHSSTSYSQSSSSLNLRYFCNFDISPFADDVK